jgi:oligoribonuclease
VADKNLLVWLDLEMTGLDPNTCAILEIATLITDGDLNLIAEGPTFAIQTDARWLDAMDDWNVHHHTASGLLARVLASDVSLEQAEARTLAFIKQYVDERAAPLCGNSIWQDRRFLIQYMPRLNDWLHYRNVDVSTIKELCRRWYPALPALPKKNAHLAMDDIRESIEELRHYRARIFRTTPLDE